MTRAAIEALRTEQRRALDLFDSLSATEWQAASGCTGWRVQDVVQHMAATFHTIADPSSLEAAANAAADPAVAGDAEAAAEVPVRARRDWSATQVMDEYREWSEKGIGALASLQEPPMADTVVPLANLGSHPMHILGNAIVFDHYCHLRHDIGATVARAAELPRDEVALQATIEWMLAGLPQMCAAALAPCSQGVNLRFDGPAAGAYALRPAADGELWTVIDAADESLPTATTSAHDFVSWGTKRVDWRDVGVRMTDVAAAQTLDAINVI